MQKTTLFAVIALGSLVLGSLALAPAVAIAQSDRAVARAHFERGVRHASAEEWRQALTAFEASLARYDRARTLFNIVVALDRLERGRECVAAAERLIAREDTDAGDRASAEQLLTRWRTRLAELDSEVPTSQSGVRMRPIDRATVRLVALRGATGPRGRGAATPIVPRAAHGSGVMVHSGGWILTARHVVEGADRLVAILPGHARAIAARVVWVDSERDLAFVRLGERADDIMSLVATPPLELGQAVDASGYPLDVTQRWPNATSGQIGRPLNDGRVQLSMALNPGNSGGPIVVDGALIGIVSQGGDPGHGVQAVVVMEPVGAMVERLATLISEADGAPELDPSDGVFLELVGGAQPPSLGRRIARLRNAAEATLVDARTAVWALEAETIKRDILRDADASMPVSLPADLRATFEEVTELADRLARALASDSSLRERYGALRPTSSAVRVGGWDCNARGACTQAEPLDRGVGWLFDLTLAGGVAVDDDQRGSFVEGAMFSALGLFHLGNFGRLDPVRFNVVLGAEVNAGTWRAEFVTSFNADLGARLAIGSPDFAVAAQLMYTPGLVFAENRLGFAYVGYRAMLSVQFDSFGLGVSWRELGRGADDTQRSLEFFLSWGI